MLLHDLFVSKQGVRRFCGKVRSGATLFFIFSILVWSLGVPLGILLPKGVNAAVTEAQAAADQTAVTGVNRVKPNSGIVTVKFGLTANASEKLNSLTFTVTGVTGTGLTAAQASDFNGASLSRDINNNDLFDDASLATGAVNVGTATTLTIAGGHTLPTAVNGSVEFYLAINAAVAAVDNRAFTVALASGTSTYVLDAGQVTATARTTQTIVIDSTAPTATNNGGPANNQTGVPVDAQIDREFSENVANATVTTTTVVLKTNTGNAQGGAPTGSNLCLGAFVQQSTRVICEHLSDMTPLSPSTWYTFQITTGLTDIAGNALAANYTVVFQTSSFQGGMGNNPPPTILGTVPAAGSTLPQNGKIMLSFSRTMNTSSGEGKVLDINNIQLFALTNGAPTGSNLFTSVTGWTYDTARNILTIASLPTLTAGNRYRLIVKGDNNTNPGDGSCGGTSEPGCVMSTDNLALPSPDFIVEFTGAANDTVLPRSLGSSPTNNATGVDRGIYDIALSFNEPIDPATVSTTTVKLYCNDTDTNASNGCDDTNGVTGTDVEITGTSVKIEADGRGIHLSPNAVLGNSGTPTDNFIVRVVSGGSGAKDLVGNSVSLDGVSAADIIVKFSTSDLVNAQGTPTYDNTAPTLSFCNGDNFGIFCTFSEPVKFNVTANATEVASTGTNDINNPTNLTIETTTDGTTYSQVFIADQNGVLQPGKSISYEAHTKTLTVDGLAMPPGQQFRVTVSTNVQDISSNAFSGTLNRAQGTVQDTAQTHGNMGPGTTTGPNFFDMGTRPTSAMPATPVAGATSRYFIEMATTTAIPASGRITLTYPTGFSFNSSCNTFPTDSRENADINGQGTGTVTVASIACDSVSRIVTLTLGNSVGTVASDNLKFVIQGVVNSTVPKDFSTSGYTVDIKTYNTATPPLLLDSLTSMPFFLTAPGAYSISGRLFVDSGAGTGGVANDEVQNGTEPGAQNIRVCLGGPVGFSCTTTDASGDYIFTLLNNGFYHVDVPPITSGTYTGGPFFRDITVNNANVTGVNFPLQQASAAFTLDVYVSGGTALAATTVDVFAFKPMDNSTSNTGPGAGGFVVREVTLDGSGIGTASLPLTQGIWNVGTGPKMVKEPGASFTPPEFNFAPPPPVQVAVSASGVPDLCTSGPGAANEVCFTLTTVQHQIVGKVVDGSGTGIANVFVMARPVFFDSTSPAMAMPAQTTTTGNFTLRVLPGPYSVEAFTPGMPGSRGVECTVKDNNSTTDNNTTADVYCEGVLIVNDVTGFSSASLTLSNVTSNDLVMKIAKGDTSVSGRVLDDTGAAIAYAHVSGEQVDSSGNPLGAWVDAPTDSSGNYTLYVAGGTTESPKIWRIRAFAPGFGELATITVSVVQGTNQTGQNLQPTSGNFVSVSGTVYVDANTNSTPDATEGVEGANVNIYGSNGGNQGVTGPGGAYTLKIKSGTGYTIEGFVPGKGPTERLTNQTLTTDPTTGKNLRLAPLGSLVVYVCTLSNTSAAPSSTNGCGSNQITDAWVNASNSSGQGQGTGVNTTAGQYELTLPAGTYTVCAGNGRIGPIGACLSNVTITASATSYQNIAPPVLYTVSGLVTSTDAACVEGATVNMVESTNGRFVLAEVSSTGTWSIQVPTGSYNASASKPGCVPTNEQLVNVTTANVTGVALTLAKGTLTLSGRVTLNSTNVTVDTVVSARSATTGKVVVVPVDTSATGTNTNYLMYLANGTWTVHARSDGYSSSPATVVVNNANATQDLPLTAIAGATIRPPQPTNITPSRGGVVKNTDMGSAFAVNVPAGALGSSTTEGSVTTDQTYAVADTASSNVLGDSGVEVTPKDSSGQPITTLSSATGTGVEITMPYTESDVTDASSTESKVMMASWSEANQQWEPISTTCDTTNNTCTGTTTHFSTFALIVASAGGAPSTPTGLAVSSVTTSQATLAWTQTSGATGYDIYRSTSSNGTFSRVGSEPTVSSGSTLTYTDTGLNAGTNYYYKISALNASGESAASSAVLATTEALRVSQPQTGGGGTVTTTPTTTTTVTTPTTQKETTKTTTPTTETSKPASGDVTSSSGGTVALEKGEAKVEVPAGAVASTTKITITPTSTDKAAEGGGGGGAAALGSLPPDYSIVGSMYDFKGESSSGSAVTQFSKDLTIVFSFTKDQIAGLGNLAIHYYDEAAKKWIPVDSTVNESSMTVTATVDHFTLFALMGVEEAEAETTAVERLVKSADNTAVYYVGANGKRYVFPNEWVYFSWYADFKGVETVTSQELAAFSMGGVITYRPGVKMLKIQTDPKVYAVGKGGVLRWIKSEATAKALYGNDWNKNVDDVNVAFWFSYKFGADINFVGDYDPAAETTAVPTINEDKGLVE